MEEIIYGDYKAVLGEKLNATITNIKSGVTVLNTEYRSFNTKDEAIEVIKKFIGLKGVLKCGN